MTRVSNRTLVLTLLAFAFSVRIAAAWFWQSRLDAENSDFRFGDSDSYWVIAQNTAKGKYEYGGENSKIFRAPLYPLVLIPFAACSDVATPVVEQSIDKTLKRRSVWYARLLGCLLGTACVWGVFHITKELHSAGAGLAAGFLAACYPGAVGMSIFILSESVFCPCMIASIIAVGTVNRRLFENQVSWKTSVVGGIFSGLAILARPSWSLWGGMLALYWLFLWYGRRTTVSPKTVAFHWLAFAVGVVFMMAPWWVRSYSITGKFVPTTLQVGASLYDGLHSNATGSSDEGMLFAEEFAAQQRQEDSDRLQAGLAVESTLEWRLDRRLRNAAIDWVVENPSDAAALSLVKLGKTWRPFPVARELGNAVIRYAEGICYLAIVTLGSLGAWVLRRELGSWFYLLPVFYFALIHMLFIGSVRYRQPAILVMCVLAGIGTCWLVCVIRNRCFKRSNATDGFFNSTTSTHNSD